METRETNNIESVSDGDIHIAIDDVDPSKATGGAWNSSALSVPSDSVESCGANAYTKSQPQLSQCNEKFRTPIEPHQVRWFYSSEDQKSWIPFCGYDSLRLENRFRKGASSQEVICVRGQLYEADIVAGICTPIYWTDKSSKIFRGIWFRAKTWQPLEEEVEEMEAEHSVFLAKKHALGIVPWKKSILHKKEFAKWSVEWNIEDVWLHRRSKSSKFSRALGMNTGMPLARGYHENARLDDRPPDISHLIFVAHGVRHKMDKAAIIKCCAKLHMACQKVISMNFQDLKSNERVAFIPIQWRQIVNLDGDLLEDITLQTAKGLRDLINDTSLDLMFYVSPLYRPEIAQAVRNTMNKTFDEFCRRNPYFNCYQNKVSLIGHSLGSVILFDILTGWDSLENFGDCNAACGSSKTAQNNPQHDSGMDSSKMDLDLSQQKEKKLVKRLRDANLSPNNSGLNFSVENLFCIGSILPVFLMLRGYPNDISKHLDSVLQKSVCGRLFNIYHPYDPVAYRLEPLLQKGYTEIPAMEIGRYEGPRSRTLLAQKLSNKSANPAATKKSKSLKKLEQRLDYRLQVSRMDMALYLVLLTSHSSYWSNHDFAAFILEQIFPHYVTD